MRLATHALLALAFLGCTREDPDAVITAYRTAVAQNDVSTMSRLTSANMRAFLDERYFTRQKSVDCIDALQQNTVRTIRTPRGVAYMGWVKDGNEYLYALLVGEPDAVNQYAALRNYPAEPSKEWQVSMICSPPFAALAENQPGFGNRLVATERLKDVPEELLIACLFEGSKEAKDALYDRLR